MKKSSVTPAFLRYFIALAVILPLVFSLSAFSAPTTAPAASKRFISLPAQLLANMPNAGVVANKSNATLKPNVRAASLAGGAFNVLPNTTTSVEAWAVFNGCNSITPTTATVTSAPTYGSLSFSQVTLVLPPGDQCAGYTGTWTVAYYTWTNLGTTSTQDPFTITWSGGGITPFSDSWVANLVTTGGASNKTTGAPCGQPGGSDGCTDPINIATGNVYDKIIDYQAAGQNKLSFTRYYNSNVGPTYAVSLGSNWRSNYDRYLEILSGTSVNAERADGQLLQFALKSGVWTPDSDVDVKLTQSGTGTGSTWTLTDKDDTIETYTQLATGEGLLKTVKARNGYTQTLSYNASNQLITVTDSYNRTLTFAYSGTLLTSITTPDGQTFNYSYQSSGLISGLSDQLNQVYDADGTINYYNYALASTGFPFALTSITDWSNNVISSWTYDSSGRGTSSQRGNGADLMSVTYNSNGTSTVTYPLGVQETYTFTTLQNMQKLTSISRAATSTTAAATRTLSYDSNGFTASRTDWNGNLTTYTNNAHGQPTTIVEASGSPVARTTTIAYDPTFVHLPDSIATPGLTTSFTYDASGNALTKTLKDTTTTTVPYSTGGQTRIWTYTYDSTGHMLTAKNPNSKTTTFTYDTTGALTKVTNPLTQSTSVTSHTGGGFPQTLVDANSVTGNIAYDNLMRPTSAGIVTAAGTFTTSYQYLENDDDKIQQTTFPDGSDIWKDFDTSRRVIDVEDYYYDELAFTLDAMGNHTATTTTGSITTTTYTASDTNGNLSVNYSTNSNTGTGRQHSAVFDALGRTLQDIGGVSQTTKYTYDNVGNSLTITDPLSNVTTRTFDALNRLSTSKDANLGITTTTYDAYDRPLTVTDPNGNITSYVYDGFGDVIQRKSPDTGTVVYYYDADGNLTQKVDAASITANYTYDALDRILTAAYPADTAENVTYTYDQSGHGFGIGRLTSVTDASGTLSRSYDERGNMTSEKRTHGSKSFTTSYSYDSMSRVVGTTYPSGTAVSYVRDELGHITSVTATPPGGSATSVVYWTSNEPFGPVNNVAYGDGTLDYTTFDLDYRATSILFPYIFNLTYGYDADNNVKTITDGVTSANNQTLGYDVINRLTSATGSYGALTYTYDKSSNRLTQKLGSTTTSYSYTSGTNRMSASGSTSLTYNANGSITGFSPGITPPAGGSAITALTYNNAGQMSAAKAGSTTSASYTYDAFGNRLLKTIGSTTTFYDYSMGQLLEEANATTGTAALDYIYMDGRPVATLNPTSKLFTYLHTDRLGTPQKGTNNNWQVVWNANYQPFGTTTPTGSVTSNLRFPGQYADSETGFYHNGFRDYAPGFGRYAESDPIGLWGGVNTYGYALQNPLSYADPMGLWTVQIGLAGSGSFWGYLTPQGGFGVTFDSQGNIGTYSYVGAGAGIGAEGGGGASFQFSNAQTICDLKGQFNNVSAHAGAGYGGSIDFFNGSSPNGYVGGGGVTLGAGVGASASFTNTYTFIQPIFRF